MTNKKPKTNYGVIAEKILDTFAELLMATKWDNFLPNPYFALGKTIKFFLEQKNLSKKQINKAFYNMRKGELIDIVEKNGEVKIYLKEKYKIKVITRSIKLLLDFKKKKKKWNGKWFIVFFDVPENERKKRDFLRKYLKKLGFYQYQKSVYIFPFECKKEIELIKKIIEGAKYMKYIVAEEIEEEEKIKKYFNL